MSIGGFFRWFFGFGEHRTFEPSRGGLHEVDVSHILDGDTLEVFWSGNVVRIRLSAIDSPEGDQPGGESATRALQKLVRDRCVYLEAYGQDQYARILATIYVMDGAELINVNERMVVLGQAWVSHAYYGHLSRNRQWQLNRCERWARSKRIGLWKESNPIPPWKWRKIS